MAPCSLPSERCASRMPIAGWGGWREIAEGTGGFGRGGVREWGSAGDSGRQPSSAGESADVLTASTSAAPIGARFDSPGRFSPGKSAVNKMKAPTGRDSGRHDSSIEYWNLAPLGLTRNLEMQSQG